MKFYDAIFRASKIFGYQVTLHIHKDQPVLIAATSLSFIFIEIAVLRIYARMFPGPNKKNDHPIAYRSS